MAKDFKLTNLAEFQGFINKQDITNASNNFLVENSKNVLSTDEGRLATRKGYTLVGAADTTLEPILGSVSWKTARGEELMVRYRNDAANSGTLEVYTTATDVWTELANSLGTTTFDATTEYWDTTENQDAMIFVVGDANLYYWSGGVTTFASATAATVTLQGTETWAERGFILSGTTQIQIEGTTYTYTGGESTTTLTGVTPDPSVAGHTVGAPVLQTVRTTANTPAAGLTNDLVATHRNQVYVGMSTRRPINISAVGDYTDFSAATVPRIVGEAAIITLNETPTAMIEQEDAIYFSTFNQWYRTQFTLSADLTGEALTIQLLKSSPRGGAINQNAVFKAKNDIIYISNEPTINSLGRVENIDTPQSKDLSDPIKKELESFTTTNASGVFWENNVYCNFPSEGKTLVFNIEKGFWEAPQVLPVRLTDVFEANLIGHSNGIHESYQLFNGTNDNSNAIEAIAAFSYLNFGNRSHQKNHVEWFTEGYISTNTTLTLGLNYDYKGATQVTTKDILGTDTDITFIPVADASLGKSQLGLDPLGGQLTTPDVLNKFRVIKEAIKEDYYEIQVVYSSNDVDQQWEILAQGPSAMLSKSDNNAIKQ